MEALWKIHLLHTGPREYMNAGDGYHASHATEADESLGCTRQSVAENAVSRYKAILGVSLSARTVKNQKVEAAIKCAVLNRMAELGMPRSERVY